jgi:sugar phosphate isomerase/epimerase
MSLTTKRLIELIKNSKSCKGVEIYIDYNKQEEVDYLDKLVYDLKQNDLILQVHGEIELDYDKQLEYIKKLESYSDFLGYPIVLTMHTIFDSNPEVSIQKTIDYISRLKNDIDNNKIIICIENLNDHGENIRLGKEEITSTVLNDESLYFTYDVGHEIVDYGNIVDLDKYMIEYIRNIHIHSSNDKGKSHMPIYKNDIHWNEIIKAIEYLVVNNYKYNIVYEYGLEYCFGDTVEEKVIDYLNSMDYVSERY